MKTLYTVGLRSCLKPLIMILFESHWFAEGSADCSTVAFGICKDTKSTEGQTEKNLDMFEKMNLFIYFKQRCIILAFYYYE